MKRIISNLVLAAVAVGGALAADAGSAQAGRHELNVVAGLTAQGAPLALRGYDPVAYFTEGAARLGTAEHSIVHGGATYRFTSQQHLNSFEKDPDRYLPQYGGFCSYGVSVGAKFDGDPEIFDLVDGKLYLNLNEQIAKAWKKDRKTSIAKAERNWQRIRNADPADLSPEG